MNLAADLAVRAARRGWRDRTAYLSGSARVTHGQVHDLAARAAHVLARLGLGPGKRLMLALPDGPDWIVTFLAAARLGAVLVITNPALTAGDHAHLAQECEVVVAVAEEPLLTRFGVRAAIGPERLMAQAAAAPVARAHPVAPNAPLYIQYTSGTTGRPAGVVHRHGDLPHHHRAVGTHMLRIHENDVSLSVSKLFFAYGFGNSLVYPLYTGSAAVLLPERPSPARVAELADRHAVTVLHAVPSALAHLTAEAAPAAFTRVRVAVSAGERLRPTLAEEARRLLGAPVLDELGSTEVGGAFCANTIGHAVLGTLGRALPGFRVQIRDDELRPITAPGVEGDLWTTGPTLMAGYLHQPERTADALRGGWLRTGDRAAFDGHGNVVHAGRADDLEMVGGITVSPLEVEQVLDDHPAVRESAVTAVPDERGATKLRAFVVVQNRSDHDAVARELLSAARQRLAPFKVPRSVEFVPALPRTATGKLQRFVLRAGRP
ncbi:AMP-binding protein [Streptomyces sp. NPDC020883]|uniref:AMP-binding protein n=1 Tax=Streptomyces sp. NPDC020883 TaxID=3365099 RepID=UPI0037999C45